MESDAYWQLDSPNGQEFTGSGLNATLRDFGRFGLFILNKGVVDGKRVLPDELDSGCNRKQIPRHVSRAG